jgi:cysteinyl-tRNA synthetase
MESHLRVIDRPDPSAEYTEGQLAYRAGSATNILAAVVAAARFLGFLTMSSEAWFKGAQDDVDRVQDAILLRSEAKATRDFATADRIRDELKAEGILLEDGPQGTTWRRA